MSDAPQGAVRRRCPVCEQVMAEAVCPRDRMATLLVDAPVHAAPALTRGEVLAGRYEILEPIGQGGYGHVYRARHLGTGQDVAVKLLRVPAEEDGAFAVQRFFLEARVTSGLTHPNTVRVFDFGQDDAGRVFLVMELLFGRTLREELRVRKARGQRFSDAEVVQIGAAITRSLAEAHEQGLVHRDLKPDNVFLHQVAGDDPVVKVLDFGIAKLGTGHRHTLSSDTSVPGTPAYMSPEHAFNQAVDGRTDLYALGVVLYQLATLELPFQAPSDPQTLYMHAYEAVPDPRAVAPVGDALAQVILTALQKKPEHRYTDARGMRAALLAVVSSPDQVSGPQLRPGPVPPVAPLAEASLTTGVHVLVPPRRAGAVWIAVAAVAALAAGGWWWSSQAGREVGAAAVAPAEAPGALGAQAPASAVAPAEAPGALGGQAPASAVAPARDPSAAGGLAPASAEAPRLRSQDSASGAPPSEAPGATAGALDPAGTAAEEPAVAAPPAASATTPAAKAPARPTRKAKRRPAPVTTAPPEPPPPAKDRVLQMRVEDLVKEN